MAVVINEFEVIAEPQSASEPTMPSAQQASAPAAQDIERIVRHQMERMARLWAH